MFSVRKSSGYMGVSNSYISKYF